jgi:hypothetical protein
MLKFEGLTDLKPRNMPVALGGVNAPFAASAGSATFRG